MDDKLRAWWSARQWLPAPGPAAAGEVLAATGWARSVGGANPYVQLSARAGLDRSTVDGAVAALEIHEPRCRPRSGCSSRRARSGAPSA